MKLFIKNIFLFVLLLLISISLLDVSTNILIRNSSAFKIKPNPKYIILGHSHPACAFNDSLIVGSKNLAKSGESYFYTYVKLKEVLKQNKNIKTVFVEFSNKQITVEMDNWIWDDKHILENYPKYSAFMNFEEHSFLIKKNFSGVVNAFPFTIKSKLKIIINKDYNFIKKIGGYVYLNRNKVDKLLSNPNGIKRRKEIFFKNINNISRENLYYLKKIIELTKNNKKEILLIRAPQHSKYIDFSNEELFQKILKDDFGDVEFLDFTSFPLNNSEFADLGHLNYKGAKKFSTWFNKLLENGLLFKNDKQNFINDNMPH